MNLSIAFTAKGIFQTTIFVFSYFKTTKKVACVVKFDVFFHAFILSVFCKLQANFYETAFVNLSKSKVRKQQVIPHFVLLPGLSLFLS